MHTCDMQAAGPTDGSCGYGTFDPATYPFNALLSISSASPLVAKLPSSGCGACFQLSCADEVACAKNSTPQVATVIDSCPSCGPLTTTQTVFTKLFLASLGRAQAQLQQVDCEPPGGVSFRLIDYRPSAGGFLKFSVKNVAGSGGLSGVAVKGSASPSAAFIPMTNTYGAVWELSNLPPPPLDIQLTNAQGQSLVARSVINTQASGSDVAVSAGPSDGPNPSPSSVTSAPAPAPASLSTAVSPPASPAATSPPISPEAPPPNPTTSSGSIPSPPTSPATAVSPPLVSPTSLPSPPAPAPAPSSSPSTSFTPIASPPPGAACQSVAAILSRNSQLNTWVSLLQDANLLQAFATRSNLTMLAPVNSAFQAPPPQEYTGSATSISALLASRGGDTASSVVGYQVLAGGFPSASLTGGQKVPTTDSLPSASGPLQVSISSQQNNGITIDGIAGVAKVLQADIAACNQTTIHVTDAVLLPFTE
ncbi:hypothetical protein WJX74_010883 [Apatococcus lobatus]|uniref:Expansin-like EG45 domain-containing protein n=1 Tax=Apatococcus lobatus TaxID=904363 RepID=A0AAW1S7T8_9CHLO